MRQQIHRHCVWLPQRCDLSGGNVHHAKAASQTEIYLHSELLWIYFFLEVMKNNVNI